MWAVSMLLAFATLSGSLVTVSIAESLSSEESKVELTELVEFEVDGEEKIVENRNRRIRRRSIVARRLNSQLHKTSKTIVASALLPRRSRHNGCGSHLRI